MSPISRRSNSSPRPIALDNTRSSNPPPTRQPETPLPSNPLANLFSADSFDSSLAGAGGAQGLMRELEGLVQTMGKLAQLLGAPDAQGAGPSEATPTPGGVAPTSARGASPLDDTAVQEDQVPELGDDAPGQSLATGVPPPAQQRPFEVSPSETDSVSAAGGKSDTKAFLGKGLHPKEQVYEEIAHELPGLGEKNKALWDAAHKAGASDEEAAIMVAQQMQEGSNDATKSGGAENFGPLNLNRSLLKDFGGVKEEELSRLNENSGGKYTPEALEANAKAALTAMRTMGTERYLDHVRGGSSGYAHPNERLSFAGPATADDDTRRFGRNIANAANHVLEDFQKDPTSISRDWRQAANIPYV